MVKEFKNLQMETFIRESIKVENHLDMDSIFGVMDHSLRDNLKLGWEMAKEYGKKIKENLTNIKVIILRIKNMERVYILGPMEMYIKDSLKTI